MIDLKVGDYMIFYDLSSPISDYTENDYNIFRNRYMKIEKIYNYKVKFYDIEKEYNLINRWGYCPFKKDIHYTRKMKIKELLKNEII